MCQSLTQLTVEVYSLKCTQVKIKIKLLNLLKDLKKKVNVEIIKWWN